MKNRHFLYKNILFLKITIVVVSIVLRGEYINLAFWLSFDFRFVILEYTFVNVGKPSPY